MILCPQHGHGDGAFCQSSGGPTCSAKSGGKQASVNLSHLGLAGSRPSRMEFGAASTKRCGVEVVWRYLIEHVTGAAAEIWRILR